LPPLEFAAIRVWGIRHRKPGPPSWLLIRRSLGPEPERKFYISNADAEAPQMGSQVGTALGQLTKAEMLVALNHGRMVRGLAHLLPQHVRQTCVRTSRAGLVPL